MNGDFIGGSPRRSWAVHEAFRGRASVPSCSGMIEMPSRSARRRGPRDRTCRSSSSWPSCCCARTASSRGRAGSPTACSERARRPGEARPAVRRRHHRGATRQRGGGPWRAPATSWALGVGRAGVAGSSPLRVYRLASSLVPRLRHGRAPASWCSSGLAGQMSWARASSSPLGAFTAARSRRRRLRPRARAPRWPLIIGFAIGLVVGLPTLRRRGPLPRAGHVRPQPSRASRSCSSGSAVSGGGAGRVGRPAAGVRDRAHRPAVGGAGRHHHARHRRVARRQPAGGRARDGGVHAMRTTESAAVDRGRRQRRAG